jgi:hypothetical protein
MSAAATTMESAAAATAVEAATTAATVEATAATAAMEAATAAEAATAVETATRDWVSAATCECMTAAGIASIAMREAVTAVSVAYATTTIAIPAAATVAVTTASVAVAATTIAVSSAAISVATTPVTVIPRAGADEDTTQKPARAVVAIGRAGIRSVIVITPLAYRSGVPVISVAVITVSITNPNSDAHTNLGICRSRSSQKRCGDHQGAEQHEVA